MLKFYFLYKTSKKLWKKIDAYENREKIDFIKLFSKIGWADEQKKFISWSSLNLPEISSQKDLLTNFDAVCNSLAQLITNNDLLYLKKPD